MDQTHNIAWWVVFHSFTGSLEPEQAGDLATIIVDNLIDNSALTAAALKPAKGYAWGGVLPPE